MARKSRKRRDVQPGTAARKKRRVGRRKLVVLVAVLAVAVALLYLKPWAEERQGGGTVTLVPHYWVVVPEEAAINASRTLMREYAKEAQKSMPNPVITELYNAIRNINPWCRLAEASGDNLTTRYAAIYVDAGRVNLVKSYFQRNYNLSRTEEYLSVHQESSLRDLVDSILNATSNPRYWLVVRPGYTGHERLVGLLEEKGIDYIYIPPKQGNIYGELAVRLGDAPMLINVLQENNLTLTSYPTPTPTAVVPT